MVRVKAWLGHADIPTSMVYVHFMPQLDAAARLTRAFSADSITGAGRPSSSGV